MFLSNLSIRQPVFATMMVVALVVVGIFSYIELKIDLFPNIDIPVISITTTYPGVAPETVETEVTKRIEEAVNPIGGIRHISSVTTEGISSVVVEFQLGKNINTALLEVQSKINGVRSLFPREVKEPVIQQIRFEELPILSIVVLSPTLDAKALTTLAEKVLKRRLENISGVGQVRLVGAARREIQILLDRDKLKAYGLTYFNVAEALRRENLDIPAGKLDQGLRESLVRVAGRAREPRDFNSLIVTVRNGFPVTLRMLGRVEDGIEEQRSSSLLDGEPALGMQIQKQTGANTVEVADHVKQGLASLQAEMPTGRRFARRPGQLDLHPGLGERRHHHADPGRHPDGAGGFLFPEQLAQHGHHRGDAAHLRHQRLHHHAPAGLHPEHDDADGAVARHRHAHRRRHRGAREHRPPHGTRQRPHDGGHRGHGGNRPRRHGHDLLRSWPSSFRWPSWAASWAASSTSSG